MRKKCKRDFDLLWSGGDNDLEVIDFPEVVKDKITICKKTEVHYDIDEEEN